MSIIKGNGSGDASSTGFYSGITPNQSLRFDGSFGHYLNRSAANISASDRRTFTFSCWFKRASIKRTQYNPSTGQNQTESTPFFQAYQHDNNYTAFYLDGTDDVVTYYHYDTGTDYGKKYFVPLRDVSNWYHLVYAMDTTQSTASKRGKVYLNGILIDDSDIMSDYGSLPLNYETQVNSGNNHSIGYYSYGGGVNDYFDGYMSDIHFIDGLQMKPEAFGQSKNGLWIPKLYSSSSNNLTKLAQNEGTVIGDFDQNGQNAAAFNGTKVQTITNSAVKNSSASAFIGKSWGTPRKILGFKITAPTTLGFVGSGATTFTVKLYGSTNTFYNQSTIDNGSLIFFSGNITDSDTRGTLSFFYNSSVESEEVYGSWDLANMNSPVFGGFRHNWVVITPNNSESVHISQVEFFDSKNITNDYYGSNGFRFDFRNKSYIGYDYQTSDRSTTNDYTVTIATQYDVLPDIPRNNFAILNATAKEGPSTNDNILISRAGLRVDQTSGTSAYAGGTATIAFPTTGKWYVEGYMNSNAPALNDTFAFGLKSVSVHGAMLTASNAYTDGALYLTRQDSGSYIGIDGATQSNLIGTNMTYSATHKIALAFDADSGKFWFGRDNGTGGLLWWNNNGNQDGNPTAGTNQTGTLTANHEYIFAYDFYRHTGNYGVTFNFGQDSSFDGVLTSGSASAADANGNGDFYYTPPTNFLALCSANLIEPELSVNKLEKPNDYFETVLYTGTGTGIARTNHNFDLDWAWIKNRSDADTDHTFYDTSRGKFIPSLAYNTSGDGNVVDNDRIDGDRALFPKDIVFPTTGSPPPAEAESGAITEIMNNGLAFGNTTGSSQTVTFPVESVEIGGERVFHPVVPLGMTISVNGNQYTEGTRLPTTDPQIDRSTLVGWNSTTKAYDNVVGLTYRPHNDDNIPDYGLGTGVLSNSNGLVSIASGPSGEETVFIHIYNTDSTYEYFIAIQQGTGNTTDSSAQDMGSYRIRRYRRNIGYGGGTALTPTTITAEGTATDAGFTQENGIITSITIKDVNVITSGLSTYDHTNKNNSKYVAWCWKANGYNPTDTITYTVKVASIGGNNRYIFNDLQEANVNLQLQKGRSYIFDVTDNSLIGHPFYVLDALPQNLSSPAQQIYDFYNHTSDTVRPKFYVNGSEVSTFNAWNDRFNSNNRSDLTSLQIRLTVPDDFRDTAYLGYGCYLHSNMGGVIYQNHARGSSNFDGNTPTVVNYSSKTKFSIVTWTVGSSPSTQTIGHGLGVKPDMIIYKERASSASPLYVWHQGISSPNDNYLQLNDVAASQPSSNWENVTSTTFKGNLNANTGDTFVAYCFANVNGFSRFGTYVGNGRSQGNYVYLGFTPSFIMWKRTDGANSWIIKDTKRNVSAYSDSRIFNPISENLFPNSRVANNDDTDIDFLSNGFRCTNANLAFNGSSRNFIYMAFAENPFKYTNAK